MEQGLLHQALVPALSALWSETLVWSEAVLLWGPLGRVSDAGQCQLLPVPLGLSYKVTCKWLSLVLDLEVPVGGAKL